MASEISNSENVARILSRDWFEDGFLLHTAFALKQGETYISVNRPAIDSYNKDVMNFVKEHPKFAFGENRDQYSCALLNVGDIRGVQIVLDDKVMDIDVEIESRAARTLSHAGIFTKHSGQIIKVGGIVMFAPTEKEVPADDILLKVRNTLLKMASVESRKLDYKEILSNK